MQMRLTMVVQVTHIICLKPDLSFQSRLTAFLVFTQALLRERKLAKLQVQNWNIINIKGDCGQKKGKIMAVKLRTNKRKNKGCQATYKQKIFLVKKYRLYSKSIGTIPCLPSKHAMALPSGILVSASAFWLLLLQ